MPTIMITSELIPLLKATITSPVEAQLPALLMLIFIAVVFYAVPIGIIIGKIRGHHRVYANNQQIKLTNPYQYYKELPNPYGIGVASLLVDSQLENEKDIVAAILDLCAQGYLHLSRHSDHYVIRMLPTTKQPTLRNEAYLLDLIRKNQLQQIVYQRWYNLCVEDGIALGLYQRTKLPQINLNTATVRITTKIEHIYKQVFKFCLIVGVLLAIIGGIVIIIDSSSPLASPLFLAAFGVPMVLPALLGMILVIFQMLGIARGASEMSYKSVLERQLTKTRKGVAELQKLLAFRSFLAQFNTFAHQNPEAIILWDRYLSYAQVFGLATELMHSGYSQIIDNAAFKIDNIDRITLDRLSLSK